MPSSTETDFIAAWESFMRAARAARGRDAQRAGDELTLAQFQLLEPLLAGPCPVGTLREAAGVSYPTATRALDAMAEKGLVLRACGAGDRRVVVVELTDAGRAQAEAKRADVAAARRRIAAQLSDDELAGAAVLLRRLTAAVEEL